MSEVNDTNFVGLIINDCAGDPNGASRLGVEFQRLFGATPTITEVNPYGQGELEAAVCLVDALDRLRNGPGADPNQEGVILVNAAIRDEASKEEWDNGVPFCYFQLGQIVVASTFGREGLALIRDLGITDEVKLLDVPTVTSQAVNDKDLTSDQAEQINNSQFRSLEFLPWVVRRLLDGKVVPSETYSLVDLPPSGNKVALIDRFGNTKTTLLKSKVDFAEGKELTLADGTAVTCHHRLTDVLDGQKGLTVGSSGFGPAGPDREELLEVVVGGGGRAADELGLKIGSPVLKLETEAANESQKPDPNEVEIQTRVEAFLEDVLKDWGFTEAEIEAQIEQWRASHVTS